METVGMHGLLRLLLPLPNLK
eukprot:COSAG04_NODE_3628_length_2662_cov_1.405384_1_plen_20_part_10